MGLADQLGYRCEAPNAFQRLNRALASSRSGAWLFSKVEHHLDELVDRLSGRRTTFTQAMAGMPVIDVTTVGARSGQPRTSPLVGIPTNGDLAIVGSGWGQAPTPGWVFNLRANPQATVRHGTAQAEVVARQPEGDELEAIWSTARELYDGYAKYPDRASHRDMSVFVLEPADDQ